MITSIPKNGVLSYCVNELDISLQDYVMNIFLNCCRKRIFSALSEKVSSTCLGSFSFLHYTCKRLCASRFRLYITASILYIYVRPLSFLLKSCTIFFVISFRRSFCLIFSNYLFYKFGGNECTDNKGRLLSAFVVLFYKPLFHSGLVCLIFVWNVSWRGCRLLRLQPPWKSWKNAVRVSQGTRSLAESQLSTSSMWRSESMQLKRYAKLVGLFWLLVHVQW